MGISGLLPLLKSLCRNIHIRKYAGKKVAVDAYVWLHRGICSCPGELLTGAPTDGYIKYCMKMVNMMLHYQVYPVLVFDGDRLPIKKGKEKERKANREYNRDRAISLLRLGRKGESDSYARKSVDITTQMAYNLIQVLKKENVEYVVAPYEADAQLAYLARKKYVHAVISEDSDLIPYGVPRMLFKMDNFGNGEEFLLKNIAGNRKGSCGLDNFSQDMIIRMCVLSGCDYLDSVKGIGIKRSRYLVNRYKTLNKLQRGLPAENVGRIPLTYFENFQKAFNTFKFQRVYDHREKKITTLNEVPFYLLNQDLEYLGPIIDDKVCHLIAIGEIDPISKNGFVKDQLRFDKINVMGFYKNDDDEEQFGAMEKYLIPKQGKENQHSDNVHKGFVNPTRKKKKKKKKRRKRVVKKSRFFKKEKEEVDEEICDDESDEEERIEKEHSIQSNFSLMFSSQKSSQEKKKKKRKKKKKNYSALEDPSSESETEKTKFNYTDFDEISPFKLDPKKSLFDVKIRKLTVEEELTSKRKFEQLEVLEDEDESKTVNEENEIFGEKKKKRSFHKEQNSFDRFMFKGNTREKRKKSNSLREKNQKSKKIEGNVKNESKYFKNLKRKKKKKIKKKKKKNDLMKEEVNKAEGNWNKENLNVRKITGSKRKRIHTKVSNNENTAHKRKKRKVEVITIEDSDEEDEFMGNETQIPTKRWFGME